MSDDDTRGDLRAAVQTLAADNARMCEIVIKADALAKAAEDVIRGVPSRSGLRDALAAFKQVRDGQ